MMPAIIRQCPNCHKTVSGHPNKVFCNSNCRYKYHNRTNPRGYYAHLHSTDINIQERDYEDDEHPFSSEALGQW